MTLSQQFGKPDFFGHCPFTKLVHDVEKLGSTAKIFVKFIQRFDIHKISTVFQQPFTKRC